MKNNSSTSRRANSSRAYKGSRTRRAKGRSFSKTRSRHGGGKRRNFNKQTISHHKLINRNPKIQAIQEYTPEHLFSEFGFAKSLMKNLSEQGYSKPTQIQDESIKHILEGRDVIGLANTGSGKTAAFVLPIIENLIRNPEEDSVLIIAPTRELAQQIQKVLYVFCKGTGIYSTVCVGGVNIRLQIKNLSRKNHVIIGTPGRLKDLYNRNVLRLNKVTTFVLDEADQMLDMGFLPDIKMISSKLQEKKQTLCFSATMTPGISALLKDMLKDPVTVSVRTSMTGEHIAQDIIRAQTKEEKMRELSQMLEKDHFEKVLIFTEMKHSAQKLSKALNDLGFSSVAIHGNKTQSQRQNALRAFREGNARIMVATGVASRGLDISDVSHVINYDIPKTHEEYVHRIGRTGRSGKPGQAYTFV